MWVEKLSATTPQGSPFPTRLRTGLTLLEERGLPGGTAFLRYRVTR